MDSYDQPSIFSRPPDEPEDPPRSPWAAPTAEHRIVRPPDPPAGPPTPPMSEPTGDPGFGSRRQIVLLAGMGFAILALTGFIAASVLGGGGEGPPVAGGPVSASPSPTASVEPSSASAAATASVLATPTPNPTPVGPPQVITQGWSRVTTALNVRSEPRLAASSEYQLIPGAAVAFLEGPTVADGYNWYEVASLGGARGWVASGTAASPFVEQLVQSSDLVRCGAVGGPVFTVSGDSIAPRDPVRIGDLALPAAGFSAEELGALELLRATGIDACFTAVMRRSGPVIYADFSYYACGHPVLRDGRLELHPSPGMDVVVEYQVKDVAVLSPGLLDRSGAGDAMSLNVRAIFTWMALGSDDAWGCFSHGVHEGPDGTTGGVQLDARQCGVIESIAGDRAVIRPATSDTTVTLILTPGSTVNLPTAVAVGMIAWAFDDPGQRYVSLDQYPQAPCP